MTGGGSQVLADRDDVHPDRSQVGESSEDFLLGLAHADDQPRLGHRSRVDPLGPGEKGKRAGVVGGCADVALETQDGLGVVVQHFRVGFQHRCQVVARSFEVRDEDLDVGTRRVDASLSDRLGEDAAAAVS